MNTPVEPSYRKQDALEGMAEGPRTRGRVLTALTTYSCGGCDNRWPGVSRCHCADCHRTFNGFAPFDKHRRDVNGVGTCIDPETIVNRSGQRALFLTDGIWSSSEEPKPRAANLPKRSPLDTSIARHPAGKGLK